MKQLNWNTNQLQKALLVVIPLLYFIVGSYFRSLLGNLSLRSCDPEYIYFMSGLTIADGVIKVGHIDNPGTPLQLLVALVFRIVYFIRSTPTPFLDDVLTHPDLYIGVVSLSLTALSTLLLLFAGYKVYKYTKNIVYAILIQTSIFLPIIWYDLVGRVAPELMMPFPVIIMGVLIIGIYAKEKEVGMKEILTFAFLSAFGMAIKLSFIPVLIIPFIVIPKWKSKLFFVGSTVLMFFIIAFPVTLQLDIFWGWIKNLFIHSGTYGKGEANIIDIQQFKVNIREMYNLEKRFFYVMMTLVAAMVAYYAIFRKKADKKLMIAGIAITVTVAIQLLLVGKHFAHRYFIPVLMLAPLMVFFTAEIIRKIYPKKVTLWAVNLLIVLLLISNIGYNHFWLNMKTEAMGNDIANRIPTWHIAQSLEKDSYKIITSQNYGSPFIEYTLMYSLVWANNEKRQEYAVNLGKLYPHTFNYFTWDNTLKYWAEPFDSQKIRDSGKKVYLYIERDEQAMFDKTIAKLHSEDTTLFNIESQLLYINPATTEVIYELNFSQPEITE
jgi:hypothetical protein